MSLDGRLIDAASIRMAENLLAKLEQIEQREGPERVVSPHPAAVRGQLGDGKTAAVGDTSVRPGP